MAETNKKYYSGKQEELIAKELGGYPVRGSGARPCAPGDVKTYDWLVECKTHTEPDHPIFFDIDVWKKICNEAMGTSRKPVLVVDDGSQKINKTWCLCKKININTTGLIVSDLPVKIRKNISCKQDKLADKLKADSKGLIVPGKSFYTNIAYEVNWNGEDVLVMPFELFKELFEK